MNFIDVFVSVKLHTNTPIKFTGKFTQKFTYGFVHL